MCIQNFTFFQSFSGVCCSDVMSVLHSCKGMRIQNIRVLQRFKECSAVMKAVCCSDVTSVLQ